LTGVRMGRFREIVRMIVDNATNNDYTGMRKVAKTMLNEYEHLLNKYRNRFFDERLAERCLAGPTGFYLMKIASLSPVRMNTVVDETPFHKSHATRNVVRLVEAGMILKTVDPEDQRGYILEATSAGVEAAAYVASVLADWDGLVSSALDEKERASLSDITRKMYLRVKHYFEEEKPR